MALRGSNENTKDSGEKRVVSDKRIIKKCLNCGVLFSIPRCRDFREHCCSSECKKNLREEKKAKRDRFCTQCGKKFRPRQYQLDMGQGRFCSDYCSKKSTAGRKQSAEWIKKRVDGFKNSDYYKKDKSGRNSPYFIETVIRDG